MLSAPRDSGSLFGCQSTLLTHFELSIHHIPQISFHRAALQPLVPQPTCLHPGLHFLRCRICYLSLIHATEGVDMLTYNLKHLYKQFVVPCTKELYISSIKTFFLENRSHSSSFPTAHPINFAFPHFTDLVFGSS